MGHMDPKRDTYFFFGDKFTKMVVIRNITDTILEFQNSGTVLK